MRLLNMLILHVGVETTLVNENLEWQKLPNFCENVKTLISIREKNTHTNCDDGIAL